MERDEPNEYYPGEQTCTALIKKEMLYPMFKDVIGQDEAVNKLREASMAHNTRQVFEFMGVGVPKGILLYGEPGTGKSHVAHAYANETNSFFYHINTPTIGSAYINTTAKNFAEAHDMAIKTSMKAGLEGRVTLFIDECESILGLRGERTSHKEDDKVVNTICEIMDGGMADPRVMFIGATNRKEMIDPAFLRAGRLDYQVEFKKPEKWALKSLYRHYAENVLLRKDGKRNFKDLDYDKLADMSVGLVGSDVAFIMKESVRHYVFEQIRKEAVIIKVEGVDNDVVVDVIREHLKSRENKDVKMRIGF